MGIYNLEPSCDYCGCTLARVSEYDDKITCLNCMREVNMHHLLSDKQEETKKKTRFELMIL